MITPQVRYPTQFPMGEINNVIGYLRGADDVDLACAGESAWNVQGFAMSFIPHDHPMVGAIDGVPGDEKFSRAELADKLEECKTLYETQTVQGGSVPGWLILLAPVIRKVVDELLDELLKR